MVGVYFSGTGNTKHCLEQFVKAFDQKARTFSMEDDRVIEEIRQSEMIIFAYPIYFSNLPKIVRDFIERNKTIFVDKKIFIIATMGLFSGDGVGVSARLFKKYGATVIGGLHLKMPDCIGDEKLLKKTVEQNKLIVKQAEIKLMKAVDLVKRDTPPREGIGFMYHMAGLFGQRLWFYNKTKSYSNKLKIDAQRCIACGLCVKICPMKNLAINNQVAKQNGKCTMCYRCVSNCPNQAITLLGSTLYEQCKIENYL